MKEYLFAVHEERSILLDLDRIKKLHIQYIREMNESLFRNSPPPISDTPEEITELLFRYEDYIIRWVEHNLNWQGLKGVINPAKLSYRQWKKAKKQVFFK